MPCQKAMLRNTIKEKISSYHPTALSDTLQVVTSSEPVAIATFKLANEIAPLSVAPFTVHPAYAKLPPAKSRRVNNI